MQIYRAKLRFTLRALGHAADDDDYEDEADQNRINAELENEMSGLSSDDDDDDFEAR